ncbi:sigma E regulatory protein, MucB/RseB [Thermosyntropha lipolytica DSM 11003]|uniref:Sigma E regulatory protein, MucB/RseB n=1 Tax=Thermosyntropha lipolytica DSM 11003 TaxID=1123382 RepID=A0A1M5JCZ5_9FIRM|nr:hypothetical protein [Thermosyntropha lipolytica]SHG38169.1 sigma E regulatory protein, MucB/RseB [Thermosyntropha lipolytica DSM 11003]
MAGCFFLLAPYAHNYYVKSKLDPGIELDKALKRMAGIKSFRYSLYSGFTVNGRGEVISRIEGEKNGENTHIKGEMVNTPVDIYYIDQTIYNYDCFADKWLVIESDQTNFEDLMISELHPLSNFRFHDISNITKNGFEKVDGRECLVVMCRPAVENKLLETLWHDFTYTIWIDYKQNVIRKAVLQAENKQANNTKLKIEVKFKDLDKEIKITPPDITAKKK